MSPQRLPLRGLAVLFSFSCVLAHLSCGSSGAAPAPSDSGADGTLSDGSYDAGADTAAAADVAMPDVGTSDGSVDAAPCYVDAGGSPVILDAIQASIGTGGVCALRQNSVVQCWGANAAPNPFPADAGAVHLTRLELGSGFGCVADDASRMWCWGENSSGQLAVGLAITSSADPLLVEKAGAPLLVDDMAVGFRSVCAVEKGTRDVYCWGDASRGQLGPLDAALPDGAPEPVSTPTKTEFTASATARFSVPRISDSFCLLDGANVTCWGDNSNLQLGLPFPEAGTNAMLPVALAGAGGTPPIADLSMSLDHACAVDSAGRMFCWGANSGGRAGSLVTDAGTPALVPELDSGVAAAFAGAFVSCAIDSQRHAHCFGVNNFGILGDDDAASPGGPVPVTVVSPDGGGALENVASLATGAIQVCAILHGACGSGGPGPLYCWGNDNLGVWDASAGVPVAMPAQ